MLPNAFGHPAGMVKKSNITLEVFYGLRLRELRSALDINQSKFAELAGVHRAWVNQAESGRTNLSVDTLERFFRHLLPAEFNSIPLRVRLSTNVYIARRALDWSQEHLAGLAGVSVGYVYRVENGIINPSLSKIELLATALNVDGQWLLEG